MADTSRHLSWIVLLYANLCWLFRGRQDVAVHGNMIWYPEEGNPKECQAPDVFVVFGRPPGHRESYLQWQEQDVPVTVVFEIISPSNTIDEMDSKQDFYEAHGVEEYYQYNPHTNRLSGFRRQGEVWRRIRDFNTWVSPRLGIRFHWTDEGLTVEREPGQPFLPFEEVAERWQSAEKRADVAEKRADVAEKRAMRLAELARKVRRGQASSEEISELEQLEGDLGLLEG